MAIVIAGEGIDAAIVEKCEFAGSGLGAANVIDYIKIQTAAGKVQTCLIVNALFTCKPTSYIFGTDKHQGKLALPETALAVVPRLTQAFIDSLDQKKKSEMMKARALWPEHARNINKRASQLLLILVVLYKGNRKFLFDKLQIWIEANANLLNVGFGKNEKSVAISLQIIALAKAYKKTIDATPDWKSVMEAYTISVTAA